METKLDLALIIPAHNEEKRIGKTLQTYCHFFSLVCEKNHCIRELIVVLNGCTDYTAAIVQKIAHEYKFITVLNLTEAGKGHAITEGFKYALKRNAALIGFVDADMATSAQEFYHLIKKIDNYDGIIASRYMSSATVIPPRPAIKRWGSKLVFEPLVKLMLGLHYKDLQCGAKLFKRQVIETIIDHLKERQWAFDVELLYLCKLFCFSIKEIPTVWHDRAESKFRLLKSGLRMLSSVISVRSNHATLKKAQKRV
ncbi:glycosyltransferase [Candidatus Dependentiae bacterium]|nr:MAG: glycosyltransferase [Candidatus Dependentiae bacterium]